MHQVHRLIAGVLIEEKRLREEKQKADEIVNGKKFTARSRAPAHRRTHVRASVDTLLGLPYRGGFTKTV